MQALYYQIPVHLSPTNWKIRNNSIKKTSTRLTQPLAGAGFTKPGPEAKPKELANE